MDNVDIFVSTSDVSSLVSLFGIAHAYKSEAHITFSKRGLELKFFTVDDTAMILFESLEQQLLDYKYNSEEEEQYIGVNLKRCYTILKGIPAKTIGHIYKIRGDDDLYVNAEGSLSREGANKIQTINIGIDTREPPINEPHSGHVKVTTADFANICASFNKQECKRIRFIIKGSTLIMRGYDGNHECITGQTFRSALPSPEDTILEEDEEKEENDITPFKIRKGKFNIVIRKKGIEKNQSIETTIDKLKPLTKINNLCKNGIVYIYICKSKEDILVLKTNVNQVGVFKVYLRDTRL